MRKSLHGSEYRALNCADLNRKPLSNVNISSVLPKCPPNNIFHRNRCILSSQVCSHALSMVSWTHGDKTFFLHLRDNVGCQLLKRTVKTGAALVENAGHINNESQMGGGTKESQFTGGDEPRRSKGRVSNMCECSQAATSQRKKGRRVGWTRRNGGKK